MRPASAPSTTGRRAGLARSGGDSRGNGSLKLARGQPNPETGVCQPRAPRSSRRLGLALVEMLVAVAILAAVGLPLLVMVETGNRESVASQNVMFAEILAASEMERHVKEGYRALASRAPCDEPFEGPPAGSDVAARFPAFQARFRGELAFRGTFRLTKVQEGLLGLEVVVRWEEASRAGQRRFGVSRLLMQEDLSLELRYRTAEGQP